MVIETLLDVEKESLAKAIPEDQLDSFDNEYEVSKNGRSYI